MNKVQRYQNIEIQIPYLSTANRFYFPDQPNLRFVSLINMVSYTKRSYNPSSLSTLPVLPNVQDIISNIFVVLYANDKESINRIPLVEFQTNDILQNYSTSFFRLAFTGQEVIWPKSYLILAKPFDWTELAGLGITGNFAIPFGVYYA
jgi:hypothetical protein